MIFKAGKDDYIARLPVKSIVYAFVHILFLVCRFFSISQIIERLSASDPDEPVEGHHFYFSMVPEKSINPNFTIRDNQGCNTNVLKVYNLAKTRDLTTFV